MIFTIATLTEKWCQKGDKSKHGETTYYEYLLAFLKSLSLIYKESVYVYILCDTDKTKSIPFNITKTVKKMSDKVVVIYRHLTSNEDVKSYAVCYRTRLFKELIQEDNKFIAYFDADMIFRKSIDHIFKMILEGQYSNIEESHLAVMHRPFDEMKRNRFQAGAIIMNNTPAIKKMVNRWDYLTQQSPMWFQDQRCLYDAWVEYKDNIELLNLESKYNDWHFNNDAHIWHCKNHVKDPKWLKEFNMYLGMAKEDLK